MDHTLSWLWNILKCRHSNCNKSAFENNDRFIKSNQSCPEKLITSKLLLLSITDCVTNCHFSTPSIFNQILTELKSEKKVDIITFLFVYR